MYNNFVLNKSIKSTHDFSSRTFYHVFLIFFLLLCAFKNSSDWNQFFSFMQPQLILKKNISNSTTWFECKILETRQTINTFIFHQNCQLNISWPWKYMKFDFPSTKTSSFIGIWFYRISSSHFISTNSRIGNGIYFIVKIFWSRNIKSIS